MKRIFLLILLGCTACEDEGLKDDNEFLQCMVDQLSSPCYADGGYYFCGSLWTACTDTCNQVTGECGDACDVVRDECLTRCEGVENRVQLYCVEGMPYTPL